MTIFGKLIAIRSRYQRIFHHDNDNGDREDPHQFPMIQRAKPSHYLQFSCSFSCFRGQTRRCGNCCLLACRLHLVELDPKFGFLDSEIDNGWKALAGLEEYNTNMFKPNLGSSRNRVYYTKNHLTDTCASDVARLAQLVRHTAQNISISKRISLSEHFSLIRKNCIQKYNSRLKDMKNGLLKPSICNNP